jgi:AbrB family looped-hinge helix DNA binding protein
LAPSNLLAFYDPKSYYLTGKNIDFGGYMSFAETTKMSSKGQVVIPENIRKRLGLKTGSQFVVVGDKDVVILKSISAPSMSDFDNMINKAREQAKMAGFKESDLKEMVNLARKHK